jgi:hypothetical protein
MCPFSLHFYFLHIRSLFSNSRDCFCSFSAERLLSSLLTVLLCSNGPFQCSLAELFQSCHRRRQRWRHATLREMPEAVMLRVRRQFYKPLPENRWRHRRLRIFSTCCSEVQSVWISDSGIVTCRYNPCGGGVEYLHRDPASRKRWRNGTKKGRAVA